MPWSAFQVLSSIFLKVLEQMQDVFKSTAVEIEWWVDDKQSVMNAFNTSRSVREAIIKLFWQALLSSHWKKRYGIK